MKAILKQLILEFHHEQIPTPFTRKIELLELPANIRKAQIFMGMRRSGKTYLMYQHIQNRLQNNILIDMLIFEVLQAH